MEERWIISAPVQDGDGRGGHPSSYAGEPPVPLREGRVQLKYLSSKCTSPIRAVWVQTVEPLIPEFTNALFRALAM